jgi:2-phosphoglycerate kinase
VTGPETVVHGRDGGLPYSKGLMSQSLSAAGIPLGRAFELARIVERRLEKQAGDRIEVAELRTLAEDVVREEEGEDAVRRVRDWQRLDKLDRPLVVLIGGTPGVGKSTLATMLAGRLGVNRVIATDAIRQVPRAFFSREFMPTVHFSAFEAGRAVEEDEEELEPGEDGDVVGYLRQASAVATGINAIVERACNEGTPIVIEGVHVLPGSIEPELRARCVPVEALLVVEDEDVHRTHFALRGGDARPADRYLARFEQIRKLQRYLAQRAADERVAVIENVQLDDVVGRLQDLVLKAAREVAPER